MSGNKQQTDFILMNVNSADIVNAARTDDAVTAAVLKTKDIIVEVKRQFVFFKLISIRTIMLKFDMDTHAGYFLSGTRNFFDCCILNM